MAGSLPRYESAAIPQDPEGSSLVERRRELDVLARAVAGLNEGRGSVVIVETVAGLGKTALIEAARSRARAAGFRVLSARARHLEAAAPFEVLRRLLGPAVDARGGPQELTGAAAFAAPLFTPGGELVAGVAYGCQWLISSVADERPLLLAVDDAHWADAGSLQVLDELASDIAGQPVALVIATRPVENAAGQALLARLATESATTVLRPAPLSAPGVRAVIREILGREPHAAFVDVCVCASNGNVFYLRELLRPLLASGRVPDATAARQLDEDGPALLARTLTARLGELGPSATALTSAAAVLGDGVPLSLAAELAGVGYQEAGFEAARLEAAAILAEGDPIAFAHPLVRAGVEHTLLPTAVGALHGRAAELLTRRGAPVAQVVQHLVAAPPAASRPVCRLLLREGRVNLASGNAIVAYQLLRRALAEPPPPELRSRVLLTLAQAERACDRIKDAAAHLSEAVDLGPRTVSLAAITDLFEVQDDLDDHRAAAELHERALSLRPYGDSPEEVRLRALLLMHLTMGAAMPASADVLRVDPDDLAIGSGEERHLLICAALHHRASGAGSTSGLLRNLRRAVADLPTDRPLAYWEIYSALEAATFLAANEAIADSEAVLSEIRPDIARIRTSAPDLQAEWNHRIMMNHLRCGRFEEVYDHLDAAEQFANRHGLTVYVRLGNYLRGWIRLERGDYRHAGRLLAQTPADEEVTPALARLLSGQPAEALRILAGAGFSPEPDSPAKSIEIQFEPHLIASHAHQMLGNSDAARQEAARELAIRRRYGPTFRLALALRRRATFTPTREAIPLLQEAVRLSAETPRLAVQARVRASLGAALRRAGRLSEARAELAAALDLTDRLDLTLLHERVVNELKRAGGRPRRRRITGPQSLTASQRTVAELAARGCSNRQIAEELYVTVKTVETHLAAVYRKLNVDGRDHLARALIPA